MFKMNLFSFYFILKQKIFCFYFQNTLYWIYFRFDLICICFFSDILNDNDRPPYMCIALIMTSDDCMLTLSNERPLFNLKSLISFGFHKSSSKCAMKFMLILKQKIACERALSNDRINLNFPLF